VSEVIHPLIEVHGHAMVLDRPGAALVRRERVWRSPAPGQLLLEVEACGVCRTDLHLIDGELPDAVYPIVPGHQIVARVLAAGRDVENFRRGQRVGVPWLGRSCGRCDACRRGEENLCDSARFTGCQVDGGFATHCETDSRFAFPMPDDAAPQELAPLLCAGLIGYRAYRMAGAAQRLGLYGFGAAAHLLTQVAVAQGRSVFAFTRRDDADARRLASSLGAAWAGDSSGEPPVALDAAIIFAPDGALVPRALASVRKGGTVVCAGIHMSDIPSFPYALLWGERTLRSVANLTRRDAAEYLALAPRLRVHAHVRTWPLDRAGEAVRSVRDGLAGCAVLVMHAGPAAHPTGSAVAA
jgi:alcohol dehydrogenase, propanol-preferring